MEMRRLVFTILTLSFLTSCASESMTEIKPGNGGNHKTEEPQTPAQKAETIRLQTALLVFDQVHFARRSANLLFNPPVEPTQENGCVDLIPGSAGNPKRILSARWDCSVQVREPGRLPITYWINGFEDFTREDELVAESRNLRLTVIVESQPRKVLAKFDIHRRLSLPLAPHLESGESALQNFSFVSTWKPLDATLPGRINHWSLESSNARFRLLGAESDRAPIVVGLAVGSTFNLDYKSPGRSGTRPPKSPIGGDKSAAIADPLPDQLTLQASSPITFTGECAIPTGLFKLDWQEGASIERDKRLISTTEGLREDDSDRVLPWVGCKFPDAPALVRSLSLDI